MDKSVVTLALTALRARAGGLLFGVLLFAVLSGVQVGAGAFGGESVLAREQARQVSAELVGVWSPEHDRTGFRLKLSADQTFVLNGRQGDYSVIGKTLTLSTTEGDSVYDFELKNDTLTLSGGDLGQQVKLFYQPAGVGILSSIFDLSRESLRQKGERIGVIFLVVAVCVVLIACLKRLSVFIIYSEWGILKYLYRRHKNRVQTIQSIILNIIKYVVYFTGLGFVLTELGINYTAYLASLSVVGLAVAFGAQGLVQDVVTGFFIIFEGQFDVGDMVEISGQTGVVQDLGLRMTRLKNYLGEVMFIPNRNISVVGNFKMRALQAKVDLELSDPDQLEAAESALKEAGEKVAAEFRGVFLGAPEVVRPFESENTEKSGAVLRLSCSLWPAQQWVIDQQLVTAIRESLATAQIAIKGDKIVSFYYGAGADTKKKKKKRTADESKPKA